MLFQAQQAFVRGGYEGTAIRGKPRFMMAPVAVMLITITGSLSYYLVTRYLPADNVQFAVMDLLLLALSPGVLALSIKSLL